MIESAFGLIEKVLIFIAFLCPLIFFHELGHFIFARLFGVRVEVFSLGFGKKIFKRIKNGTEYAVSIIPLGGYIKMFGDDPTRANAIEKDQQKYAFNHKGKWARFWIVFGGPLANFILAFALFYAILLVGEKVPEARFGVLDNQNIFYQAGVRTGDKLVSINNQDVTGLTDLALGDDDKKITKLQINRNGVSQNVSVNLSSKEFLDEFTSLYPLLRLPIFINGQGKHFALSFVSNQVNLKLSIEEMVHLKLGQMAYLYPIKLDEIKEREDLEKNEAVNYQHPQTVMIEWNDGRGFYNSLAQNGFYPIDLVIEKSVAGSPAEKSGIKPGDIILAIDQNKIWSFEGLRTQLQKTKDQKKVNISLLRNDQEVSIDLTPKVQVKDDKSTVSLGVYSSAQYVPMNYVEGKPLGIIKGAKVALTRTWETMVKTIAGFAQFVTGSVPFTSMGGPIAIGKVAADSLNISLTYFFKIMAIISVNLGIVNLFPVPVLDGGHILFILFELVNRGPLSRRKMEIAQQFGVSLLFLLIFLALFNDISRLFS